jgi:hypothetical protein
MEEEDLTIFMLQEVLCEQFLSGTLEQTGAHSQVLGHKIKSEAKESHLYILEIPGTLMKCKLLGYSETAKMLC